MSLDLRGLDLQRRDIVVTVLNPVVNLVEGIAAKWDAVELTGAEKTKLEKWTRVTLENLERDVPRMGVHRPDWDVGGLWLRWVFPWDEWDHVLAFLHNLHARAGPGKAHPLPSSLPYFGYERAADTGATRLSGLPSSYASAMIGIILADRMKSLFDGCYHGRPVSATMTGYLDSSFRRVVLGLRPIIESNWDGLDDAKKPDPIMARLSAQYQLLNELHTKLTYDAFIASVGINYHSVKNRRHGGLHVTFLRRLHADVLYAREEPGKDHEAFLPNVTEILVRHWHAGNDISFLDLYHAKREAEESRPAHGSSQRSLSHSVASRLNTRQLAIYDL